jgi:hypothetical protein
VHSEAAGQVDALAALGAAIALVWRQAIWKNKCIAAFWRPGRDVPSVDGPGRAGEERVLNSDKRG